MTRTQEKAFDLARFRAQKLFATWSRDDDKRLYEKYAAKSDAECQDAIDRFNWAPTERELEESRQGIEQLVRA